MITRREGLKGILASAAAPLAGCASWIDASEIGEGKLEGRVYVEWISEDRFIYQPKAPALSFTPSFMTTAIVPERMYTDGGSVPRVFWSIPGLSPWGLGPAYIIHDWIFEVHRCKRTAPAEVAAINFKQSALILAEVGKALIAHGLIQHDMLDAVIWGVRTRYAEDLWKRPGTPHECKIPPRSAVPGRPVIDFIIPPRVS